MRSLLLGATLSAAVCLVVGCAANDSATESTNDELVGDAMTEEVDVQADRLVFSARVRDNAAITSLVTRINTFKTEYANASAKTPASAKVSAEAADIWVLDSLRQEKQLKPVILVGGRNPKAILADNSIDKSVKNSSGYLRRAVGVQQGLNGETIVLTQPSNMVEAHEELAQMGLFSLERSNDDGDNDGWQYAKDFPFTLVDLDLNKTLFHKDLPAGLGQVDVGLTDSHLRINGDFDAFAHGKWLRLKEAHALLNINMDGQLQLQGRFDGGFAASTGEKKLYEKEYAITSVAGRPLALAFTVVANCDFGANGNALATVGTKVNGKIQAGGTYDRDGAGAQLVWQPTWPQFQRIGPSITSAARVEGTCTITATALAKVFDESGPQAQASAFLKLVVNADGSAGVGAASGNVQTTLTSGVDAGLSGSLEPFGVHLLDINPPGFHREWTLFDQPLHFQH